MTNTVRALEPLLEPQERLDRVIAAAFRRFGPRLVDLSYANPYEGPPAGVLDVLKRAAAECTGRSLQYTPCGGRTAARRAVAAALSREYALPFTDRDVVMTSGAMSALNIVSRALFGPEDEVIVLTPAWQDYPLYLRNLNIPVRLVPLGRDKRLDLEAIGAAIGPKTRGILFSQPCCPTGVLYGPDEIGALAAILSAAEARHATEIYVISDEVHRHMIWSGRPFHSPLHSHPRTLSIYSFGKALSLQGQRIGYIAVSPRMAERDRITRSLERSVRLMGFGNPTSLMQYAICDLLDYEPDLGPIAASHARVRRALAEYGYEVCEGQASFYVYVTSPIADDFAYAERLAAHGVLVAPGTLFHDPGYFRLSLTARPEAIAASLPIFERVRNDVSTPCSNVC